MLVIVDVLPPQRIRQIEEIVNRPNRAKSQEIVGDVAYARAMHIDSLTLALAPTSAFSRKRDF